MLETSPFSFPIDEILAQIPTSALWLGLLIFGALTVIMSLVLIFHWNKYKFHSPWNSIAQGIYIVGLATLLVLSFVFLSIFTS